MLLLHKLMVALHVLFCKVELENGIAEGMSWNLIGSLELLSGRWINIHHLLKLNRNVGYLLAQEEIHIMLVQVCFDLSDQDLQSSLHWSGAFPSFHGCPR